VLKGVGEQVRLCSDPADSLFFPPHVCPAQVFSLTRQAMGGSMSFRHSLTTSLNLIRPSLQDIHGYVEAHPPQLTDGIEQLVSILHRRGTSVYLVGIFRE